MTRHTVLGAVLTENVGAMVQVFVDRPPKAASDHKGLVVLHLQVYPHETDKDKSWVQASWTATGEL